MSERGKSSVIETVIDRHSGTLAKLVHHNISSDCILQVKSGSRKVVKSLIKVKSKKSADDEGSARPRDGMKSCLVVTSYGNINRWKFRVGTNRVG